jgi:hypothetical protein
MLAPGGGPSTGVAELRDVSDIVLFEVLRESPAVNARCQFSGIPPRWSSPS